jgi:hypothetical protein
MIEVWKGQEEDCDPVLSLSLSVKDEYIKKDKNKV